MRAAALLLASALFLMGCASLEKTTMQTEFTLSALNSMCFHVLGSVDAKITDDIRVENLNGNHDGAVQSYADYKPKIEQARNVCNGSDDTVQNADKERKKIPTCGDAKNFTAWLPSLAAAIPMVEQAIADVKAMVQK